MFQSVKTPSLAVQLQHILTPIRTHGKKYLMFAPLDIFTSVVSPKVGVLLFKHSAILSAIALFCEKQIWWKAVKHCD
jgi:hypothetical protein